MHNSMRHGRRSSGKVFAMKGIYVGALQAARPDERIHFVHRLTCRRNHRGAQQETEQHGV